MGQKALEVGGAGRLAASLIQEARIERELPVAQLSSLAGVSRPRLTRILATEVPMTFDEMWALCEALSVDPVRLVESVRRRLTGEGQWGAHALIKTEQRMKREAEERWEALAAQVVDFPTIQPAPPVGLTAAARQVDGRPEWEAMHQWDDAGEESQDPGDWDGEVERNLREREEGARIAASFDVAAHNVEDSVDDDNANL